jgi:hypothetical protein
MPAFKTEISRRTFVAGSLDQTLKASSATSLGYWT